MTDLPAGPDLDCLVAEKVMGWEAGAYHAGNDFHVWQPSTNIAHAWEVVEKLQSLTLYAPGQKIDDRGSPVERWTALFQMNRPGPGIGWADGEGDTAPLAICRAALKAIE